MMLDFNEVATFKNLSKAGLGFGIGIGMLQALQECNDYCDKVDTSLLQQSYIISAYNKLGSAKSYVATVADILCCTIAGYSIHSNLFPVINRSMLITSGLGISAIAIYNICESIAEIDTSQSYSYERYLDGKVDLNGLNDNLYE